MFAFSAAADYNQPEQNAKTIQDNKLTESQNKNTLAESARSLMQTIGSVYDQNIKEINRGKRLTLGSVFQGAATVSIAYVSGGSTLYASVPSAISTAVRALGLAGSINASSALESAYESAISELRTRIWETSAAIARYKSAWNAYSSVVTGHNSSNHGGTYSYASAHSISAYQPPSLNENVPSFWCHDGSCGLSWSSPSMARTVHYARCGTSDDLYGCNVVYYTCNSSGKARHQPQDCGLYKWKKTTHGWTETICPGDYRKCTYIARSHSTLVTGVNTTSKCGPGDGSSPQTVNNNNNNGNSGSTPTMLACGVHSVGTSGDHSLQASCSSVDSNGTFCSVTSFYACSDHSHEYFVDSTPACSDCATGCSNCPSSGDGSGGDPGGSGSPTCSSCSGSYDPTDPDSYTNHQSVTCIGCGASFTGCTNDEWSCSTSGSGWHSYE
ncbi:hypothetical protein F4Z99_19330 [Candidatus Poribacteria bacterium]|nr:hypothetical protein [Candidatus Poribacteria bacterium]